MTRREGARRQHVSLALSELAVEALTEQGVEAAGEARLEGALRYYVSDKGTERAAWPYPGFLRGSETREQVRVEIEVDAGLWREFGEEAASQGVTVGQLAEHAAFYFAAEVDAGRVTKRILADLEREADASGG
ncbi:MAG TPA: hypothetical protein VFN18_00610 [Solirubrobacterales bacterium]|nr:hypothetical protein [Solirubrobacterales bacterium]